MQAWSPMPLRSGWSAACSRSSGRRPYRHLLDDALDLEDAELSLLAVLMLRGTQTPGELKQRADRLHGFTDLAAVHEALELLVERGYVARLERRPGQKEERYAQVLGGGQAGPPAVESVAAASVAGEAPGGDPAPEDRLERLERELTELRAQVQQLREALGEPSAPQA
jgi:uncharacterized protein YceH (UPF0502 family)